MEEDMVDESLIRGIVNLCPSSMRNVGGGYKVEFGDDWIVKPSRKRLGGYARHERSGEKKKKKWSLGICRHASRPRDALVHGPVTFFHMSSLGRLGFRARMSVILMRGPEVYRVQIVTVTRLNLWSSVAWNRFNSGISIYLPISECVLDVRNRGKVDSLR